MNNKTIKVVSRSSQLALIQTDYIISLLTKYYPSYLYEVITVTTKGDQVLDVSLSKIGDKGLFTKELEDRLINRECDFAIHSAKDLPSVLPEQLTLAPFPKREDPWDVLISRHQIAFHDLPPESKIGTSSLRRVAQLKRIRSDLDYQPIRGNMQTRLHKLESGQYDALVVAYAGIKRLGIDNMITEQLTQIIPAVGQGAIAIEYNLSNQFIANMLSTIGDAQTTREVQAERSFLRTLQGGCQVPIGAIAHAKEQSIDIKGFVSDLEGTTMLIDSVHSIHDTPEQSGRILAQKLIDQGALNLIKNLY